MNPTGSEAELPDVILLGEATFAPVLKPVSIELADELSHIAVLPVGDTGLDHQIQNFHRWAEKHLNSPAGNYMHLANLGEASHPGSQRLSENNLTLQLYKETFSSFMWTGIECSNPESPHGERWDQLALTEIYKSAHRRKQIGLMQSCGIENVRLGMPNHKMVEQNDWRCFTNVLKDFKAAGIKVSLDLQHFGLPSHFRNNETPEESVYLNPAWPKHFVEFAMRAVKKHLPALEAITLVNEPLITNRFSGCFWNEAMPGSMTDDRYNYFFIKRALLIAKAAVQARYEIERYLQKQGRRIIFIHNESCEHHADNVEFNEYSRFLASDLILGHEWFLDGDFTQTEIFQWMRSHVNNSKSGPNETDKLIQQIEEIKAIHQQFQTDFGKSMKADTVFGVDYYAACETVKLTSGFPKPTSVDTYTEEVENSHRRGLAGMCIEYWNRYQLPILHTETNFVDHGESSHVGASDDWGMKQLIELAQLPKLGVPILGFTWYSLMDQFNWHNGMQGSPQETRLHPVGLYSWPDYQPRPFTANVLPALMQSLNHQ